MLYEDFDRKKKEFFIQYFDEQFEITKNLNPVFAVREYQKIALGRFYYYLSDQYAQEYDRTKPIHLMFNMATGSGKTLIMAANILYLYQKGYRHFIFFTRLGNIIQKTKANFLDSTSKKYLFADKIILGGKEVKIKEVDNFEGVNDDVNIIFTTIANLHNRFNFAKENAVSYEDLADKKIVLLGDEAHNFQAQTAKEKEEEKNNWEKTILGNERDLFNFPGILNANPQKENILLEFTATARLEDENIKKKYENKVIYRYDLKQFRLDGFSKEVETKQISAPVLERALAAVVVSQYRRKVAEKYKIALKPVILFKANRVTVPKDESLLEGDNPRVVVSHDFQAKFQKMIAHLQVADLENIKNISETGEQKILQKAFAFFVKEKISLENLVAEIKTDFAPEKCLTVDEPKEVEQKQILLNSLEDQNNEIRAIFATEKLNEGWDVLNLFDIVRLYNSRDAKNNKPGKTTVQEAQLIGRGARYYPFTVGEFSDAYRRKFDDRPEEELQVLEQLYYHSTHNPDYISELRKALVAEGIIAKEIGEYPIEIKEEFMRTDFWQKGLIFLNRREKKNTSNTKNLEMAGASFDTHNEANLFVLPTRTSQEQKIWNSDQPVINLPTRTEEKIFSEVISPHIARAALGYFPDGTFARLKEIWGSLESVADFINSKDYLAGVKVKIRGTEEQRKKLANDEQLHLARFVIGKVLEEARKNKAEYQGSKVFFAQEIKKTFPQRKVLHLDKTTPRAQELRKFQLANEKWFAQNEIWGTSEEEKFLDFMQEVVEKLKSKYQEIALLRNEQFFKIYNFSDGEAFAPDFVLFLKDKEYEQEIVYQIFIEPKNEILSQAESWKEEFLLLIEKEHKTDLDLIKFKNKDFKLIGLPFFNQDGMMRERFEKAFEKQLLS